MNVFIIFFIYFFVFVSLKKDEDMKHLKTRFDYMAVRHAIHEKKFRYGSDDLREAFEKENFNLHGIIVPLAIHEQNWGLKKVKESIRLCLKHVLIQIHDEIFERTNGILQGSVVPVVGLANYIEMMNFILI